MLYFDGPETEVEPVIVVGDPPPEGFEIPPGMTWDEWVFGPSPIDITEVEGIEVVAEGPTEVEEVTVTAPFGQGIDPSDLPAIIRALMCSQIDKELHEQTNRRDQELGGHIERTEDGYVIDNLHWGTEHGQVVIDLQEGASMDEVPFYIHFHDDKSGVASLYVSRGPSADDLVNSRNNGIWQIVVDHEGYVYVINNRGDLVLPNGDTIPFDDAVRSRKDGLLTKYPKLESPANSWGSVNGSCQSA